MGFSFRDFAKGFAADVNVRDGGRSHGNMQARRRPQVQAPILSPTGALKNGTVGRQPNGVSQYYSNVEYNPGTPSNPPVQKLRSSNAPINLQLSPGGPLTPITNPDQFDVQRPLTAKNRQAIPYNSTPLATSVFAPMNKQTRAVVDPALKQFNATPRFEDLLNSAQPNAQAPQGKNNLKSGIGAASYRPGFNNQYQNEQQTMYGPGYGSSPSAVIHEGLHSAWFKQPNTRNQFAKAYESTTPSIRDVLDRRLQGYKQYGGRQSLDKYNSLSPDIQSELHSYISGMPAEYATRLPTPLQDYYKQYIDPNASLSNMVDKYEILRGINQTLRGYKPMSNGRAAVAHKRARR